MSADECVNFMLEVRSKGSRLPDIEDITQYSPSFSLR